MKKHTIAKRAAAFALAAVMTAGLFGCGEQAASGSGSPSGSGDGGSATSTGRWRQEEVTPGENANIPVCQFDVEFWDVIPRTDSSKLMEELKLSQEVKQGDYQ